MKNLASLSILCFIISCSEGKNAPLNKLHQNTEVDSAKTKPENLDPVLRSWLNYYQPENPDFDAKKFYTTDSSAIKYQPTTVKILNEKGFSEMYKPFLVFNKSGTQYLDFDSYHWSMAPDGDLSFEADQQVVLVNLKNKTALQIAFLGPSFRIEDAYWPNDSTAVLLGNTYEKVPFQMKLKFNENTVQHHQYPDTLKFNTPYYENRIRQKLKNAK